MVKKKAKGSDQSSVSSEQVVELQEPEPVPGIEEYTKGMWAGRAHYQCKLCTYDVLDNEEKILEHVQLMHHPRPVPKRASSVLVADKRGNDVTHQAASEDDGDLNQMFEVELKEVESTTDEQGNEHKTYTIKE